MCSARSFGSLTRHGGVYRRQLATGHNPGAAGALGTSKGDEMASALACVGLAVSDKDELQWLVTSARRAICETGIFDGVHVGRWQDDSGAALILGWQSGELVDFAPAYTAASGGLLAGCRLINESVAFAKVVDADGHQLT